MKTEGFQLNTIPRDFRVVHETAVIIGQCILGHGWSLAFKAAVISHLCMSAMQQIAPERNSHFDHAASQTLGVINTENECIWKVDSRTKIGSVGLNLCLHIGIPPPDTFRAKHSAKVECWIDPATFPTGQKASEVIGNKLQSQYENMQPKAKYRLLIDPSVDDLKKQLISLRKHAKGDRVLFHYTGHGVPKPTVNGEIWVFNKAYTQYIPLSIYEIDSIIGRPSLYVFDMSCCKNILDHLGHIIEIAEEKCCVDEQFPIMFLTAMNTLSNLPTNPELPMDLFTSCLTSPVETSIYWLLLSKQNNNELFGSNLNPFEVVKNIPGKHNDRKSPLGELCWIFTCIADNIAWEVVPRNLFRILFRQDLLLASLFRNFLLAMKIMSFYGMQCVSYPSLPDCSENNLWYQWTFTLEEYICSLECHPGDHSLDLKKSFFEQNLLNLTHLTRNSSHCRNEIVISLPILLQILLSQNYRTYALDLFCCLFESDRFFIEQSFIIGIFPYLLKLVQSSGVQTRIYMARIWAAIFVNYPETSVDFYREKSAKYFIELLKDPYSTEFDLNPIMNCLIEYLRLNVVYVEELYKEGLLMTVLTLSTLPDYYCSSFILIGILLRNNYGAFLENLSLIHSLIDKFTTFHHFQYRSSIVLLLEDCFHLLLPSYSIDSADFTNLLPITRIFKLFFDFSPNVRIKFLQLLEVLLHKYNEQVIEAVSIYFSENSQNTSTIFGVLVELLIIFSRDYDLHIEKEAKKILTELTVRLPNDCEHVSELIGLLSVGNNENSISSSDITVEMFDSSFIFVDLWKTCPAREILFDFHFNGKQFLWKLDSHSEYFHVLSTDGFLQKFPHQLHQTHKQILTSKFPLSKHLLSSIQDWQVFKNDQFVVLLKQGIISFFDLNQSVCCLVCFKIPIENALKIQMINQECGLCWSSDSVLFFNIKNESIIKAAKMEKCHSVKYFNNSVHILYDSLTLTQYSIDGLVLLTLSLNFNVPVDFYLNNESVYLVYRDKLILTKHTGESRVIWEDKKSIIFANFENSLVVVVCDHELIIYELQCDTLKKLYQVQSVSIQNINSVFIHSNLPVFLLNNRILMIGETLK